MRQYVNSHGWILRTWISGDPVYMYINFQVYTWLAWTQPYSCTHTASHHSLFLPRTGNCRGSGWWALRWSESLQNELFFQTRRRLKYMSLRHAQVLWILIILLIELDRENQSCWYFDLQSPDVKDPCICIYTIITIQNMCLYVFIVHYNDKVPASLLHKTLDAIHCK